MTFLAVDVGNSDVSYALYGPDGARRSSGAVPTADAGAPARLAALRPAEAAIASVVPAATPALRAALEAAGARVRVLVAADLAGLRLDVERPDEVGIDRAVNAWMGARRHGRPLVVVDMGTATTFDVVGADGAYRGGAIAPGLRTGLAALLDRAARLDAAVEDVLADPRPAPVGRSTLTALRAGAVLGHAAMVDGMVRRLRAALAAGGGGDLRAVATGGLAALVAPHCAEVAAVDPALTLDGIHEACRTG